VSPASGYASSSVRRSVTLGDDSRQNGAVEIRDIPAAGGSAGVAVVDALDEQTVDEHTRAHNQGQLGRMISV
jgi:hypothetical protein